MSGSGNHPATGVVVTGGGSGIGRATGEALAAVGRPVALWDLNGPSARAAAGEIAQRHGVPAVGIELDVVDFGRYGEAIDESRQAMGTIGGLVHGAGIPGPGAIDELAEETWDTTVDIHLKAAAMLIRDLVPDLAANPGSAVVLIASIEAIVAHDRIPAYCSAKAGMLGLARSAAARLAGRRIRVNSVCPGFIATPMFLPALDADPGGRAAYERRIPLGRLGEPEDIARTIRFLLSGDAAYITAAEIVVDGGVTRTVF